MALVRVPLRRNLRRGIDRRVERELHARGYAKPGDDRAFRDEIQAMFDSGPLGQVNPRKGQFVFFSGISISNALGYQIWHVPRNATWIYMICVGSGASGAGGQSSGAGVLGGGGGGGGSGALGRLLIPATFLPKSLYVRATVGGISSAAGIAGKAGVISSITDSPNFVTSAQVVLRSGAAPAGATVAATGASSPGGSGETITVPADQMYTGLGLFYAIAGQAGTAGGASAGDGVSLGWGLSGIFSSGGTGGGTTDTGAGAGAGGQITGGGLVATAPGGAAGSPGANGTNYGLFSGGALGESVASGQIFASTGGTGGGAGASTTGGAGGNGGWGSGGGGGGGGGGTSGGTGGKSGAGGSGFVVIIAW